MDTIDKSALKAAALEMTDSERYSPPEGRTAQLVNLVDRTQQQQEASPAAKFNADLERYFSKVIFDDMTRPLLPTRWRVRDTMEVGGICFIGGQSAAGKSFIVMESIRCLTLGIPFFGRTIDERCGVVLFAPEGQSTIDARMAAMKRHHGIREDLPFAYLGELPDIQTPEGRALIVALLRRIDEVFQAKFRVRLGTVFMDTLAATFQLKDQNDSSEAARIIGWLREIQREVNPEVTLCPVHHYGKTVEQGLTGGHGWKAGADQVLSVLADRNEITGECTNRELHQAKNRNGPEGPIAPFTLEYMGLGYREDGTEWGSLYLVPQMDKPTTFSAKRAPKVPKHIQTFSDAVTEAILYQGVSHRIAGGQGPTVKAVRLSPTVRELFFAKYPTGTDDPAKSKEQNESARYEAKKKAFQRAVAQMGNNYATEDVGGTDWIWLTSGDIGDAGDNSHAS